MSKMMIYEPAMCCPTGVCGVGVDPELLRISTVLNTLKNNGIVVERFNLNSAPMEFIKSQVVNEYINAHGPDGLPVTVVDDKIVVAGRYPTNEEFVQLLHLPAGILAEQRKAVKAKVVRKNSCCNCGDGCC